MEINKHCDYENFPQPEESTLIKILDDLTYRQGQLSPIISISILVQTNLKQLARQKLI